MASVSKSSVFFLLSYLVLLCSAKDNKKECTKEFDCGTLGKLHFPFSNTRNPDCGLFIKDCDKNTPKIQLAGSERSYEVVYSWPVVIGVKDRLHHSECESLTNLSLPSFPSLGFSLEILTPNRTLYKCERNRNISCPPKSFKSLGCNDNEYEIWYSPSQERLPDASKCSIIQIPIGNDDWLKPFEFVLQVRWSEYCLKCHRSGGGYCQPRNGTVHCDKRPFKEKRRKWVIPLGTNALYLIRLENNKNVTPMHWTLFAGQLQ